jgi:hypothetical protein
VGHFATVEGVLDLVEEVLDFVLVVLRRQLVELGCITPELPKKSW